MSDLELPLTGRDWTISLPLEDWSRLIECCKEVVIVSRDERLDQVLQQALAAAVASPPPDDDVHIR
jgi:hypothetical protein